MRNRTCYEGRIWKMLFGKAIVSLQASVFLVSGFRYHNSRGAAILALIGIIVFPCIYLPVSIFVYGKEFLMVLAEIVLVFLLATAIFMLMKSAARASFISGLPETLKIINSRFISRGNIARAISVTLEQGDLKGPSRKVMADIRDVLLVNNMYAFEEMVSFMTATYNDTYLKFFLNLVKQAHYKGGSLTVRTQMEELTEEILAAVENRKDLISASAVYIVLLALMPPSAGWIERFNRSVAADYSVLYYSSAAGFGMRYLIYFAVLLSAFILLCLTEGRNV